MITDDEVMRLFEQADPARTTDDHDDTPDAAGYLSALRTRSNNVTYIETTTETSTEQPDHRRWYMIGAAVAAVALLVVGGLVLLSRDDASEPEVPATVPPTLAPPVEDAVGRAREFLASFQQRDLGLVEEQLAAGFTMQSAFPNESFGEPSTGSSNDWMDLRYQVATATRYLDPVCSVVASDSRGTVVECETAMELVVHQVADEEGVPTTVAVTLNSDGVVDMASRLGRNFGNDLRPFDDWVEANRPDSVEPFEEPQNFAELEQNAQAEAQLAAEWVAFGVDAVEGAFADHNAGNLDEFLARFDEGAAVLGVNRADSPDVFGALMAGGNQYVTSNCEPDGIESNSLAIVCDVAVEPPSRAVSGVELTGTIHMAVRADGTIVSNTLTVASAPFDDFNSAFEQWLAAAHPDVHGQVIWVDIDETRIASADDQEIVAPYYEEFVAQSDVYPIGG